MLLSVPEHFSHVVFQVAQLSSFLQNVKEQRVVDNLRRLGDIWMIDGTQRVHFASLEILFRSWTPAQLLLVDLLCTIKSAGWPVPNMEYLRNPAILLIGWLDDLDYLIDFGKLYWIPRDNRSDLIRYDTRRLLFFRLLDYGIKVFLVTRGCMGFVFIGLFLSRLHLLFTLVLLDDHWHLVIRWLFKWDSNLRLYFFSLYLLSTCVLLAVHLRLIIGWLLFCDSILLLVGWAGCGEQVLVTFHHDFWVSEAHVFLIASKNFFQAKSFSTSLHARSVISLWVHIRSAPFERRLRYGAGSLKEKWLVWCLCLL